jgi:integrase
MAGKKPKIANVWWRNGWAWGRIQFEGHEYREPLDTQDPRDARERVQAWIKSLKDQKWGKKPRRTFDEAADKFIAEHLPNLKRAADGELGRGAKRYLQSLIPLTEHFSGKALEEIGSGLLSAFEQRRRKQGVSTGTIRNDLWCLSSIFTRALEWEWVPGNPVAAYIRARTKRGLLPPSAPHTRYCSHDEEAELILRCKGKLGSRDGGEKQDHVMLAASIALTIDIGLRKEELLQGDWTMVDLERKEWTVPAWLAKSGRARTIPILPRSLAILQKLPRSDQVKFVIWRSELRTEEDGTKREVHDRYFDLLPMLQDIASGGRSYIFRREATKLKQKGLRLTADRRAAIAALAERQAWAVQIPKLIWHDLRRTCGCRLLQDYQLPMEAVSKWLGHSSVKVTEKAYAFLEVKHLHAAVGKGPETIESRHTRLIEGRKIDDDGVTNDDSP